MMHNQPHSHAAQDEEGNKGEQEPLKVFILALTLEKIIPIPWVSVSYLLSGPSRLVKWANIHQGSGATEIQVCLHRLVGQDVTLSFTGWLV